MPVALDFAARDIADHFLVCRAEAEIALVAVLDTQQFRAILFPARGFLPQLRWLHRRHQQFDGAAAVHFLADDVFNFAQHAQAERHPGVDAAGQAFDQAGPQHELVADDFGFGRSFLQSGY